MSHNKDKMYKLLAASYADQDGARLKAELDALEKSNFKVPDTLDTRIQKRIQSEKRRKKLFLYTPVAACLLVTIMIYISQNDFSMTPSQTTPIVNTTPSQNYDLEFISARLPARYVVTNINYDNGKAIYHIENELENKIIMTVEASDHPINNKGLRVIDMNGTKVYGISKSDYSLLMYEKDHTMYTLTSKFTYLDLIEISEKIISFEL